MEFLLGKAVGFFGLGREKEARAEVERLVKWKLRVFSETRKYLEGSKDAEDLLERTGGGGDLVEMMAYLKSIDVDRREERAKKPEEKKEDRKDRPEKRQDI